MDVVEDPTARGSQLLLPYVVIHQEVMIHYCFYIANYTKSDDIALG